MLIKINIYNLFFIVIKNKINYSFINLEVNSVPLLSLYISI